MRSLLLSLLLLPLSLAANLEIDYQTPDITCTRKTQNGDSISMRTHLPSPCLALSSSQTTTNPPTDYRGTLLDGTPFDASYDRGQPLTFKLGSGQVIKGWDQGLTDMCIGEKRKLTIAPELAYGDRAMGPIPAGSVLVFETELVGIKGVKAEEKKGEL